MVIRMIQDHSTIEHAKSWVEYSFYLKDNKIASFVAPNPPMITNEGFENSFTADYTGRLNLKVNVEKNNNCPTGYEEKLLVYVGTDENGFKKQINKYSYNYYNKANNQKIGSLNYITEIPPKKKLFDLFRGYGYKIFNYNSVDYCIYYVPAGKDGIFYCVHVNNEIVALIKRDEAVYNHKDCYTIYALNNVNVDALCLIAAHYDYTHHEQAMPKLSAGVQTTNLYNKDHREEIINKYDPTFIQKILDIEEKNFDFNVVMSNNIGN